MRARRFVTGMAVAATVMSMLGPGRVLADEADFDVKAGALHATNPSGPFEFTRYYPEELKVHRGQTVRWTVLGNPAVGSPFHTVTFSASGRPPGMRGDEVGLAMTEEWTFGSGCGLGTSPACVLDGSTTHLSSGVPPFGFGTSPFRVAIDLPVGTYDYFCTVHTTMTGEIEVVADSQPVPTQEEIDDAVALQIAADSQAATQVLQDGQVPHSTVDPETGQVVWRVFLGDETDDDHVSILAFLPSSLPDVRAGDMIAYRFDGGIDNEIHSVTFPGPAANVLFNAGFYPSCDFDDPGTGAKGIPGLWGIVGPPCPANLELGLSPWMAGQTRAPADAILTAATYHDSGILVPPGGQAIYHTPDGPFPTTFEAQFPATGSFEYACTVHGVGMSGTVTVT